LAVKEEKLRAAVNISENLQQYQEKHKLVLNNPGCI